MIESELKYTQENVGEFVKYTIFRKNRSSGIYMICYLAAMVLIAVAGAVLAAVTQMWMFLLAVVVCLLHRRRNACGRLCTEEIHE